MAASFADVASIDATTHSATLNFQSDQLGNGYLANQIQVGHRVVTSTKRQYSITAINSTTFSSASVTLLEIGNTTAGPNGVAVVYSYDGSTELIPVLPPNATGISTAHLAIILNHNLEVIGALDAGGLSTVVTDGDIDGTGTPEDPVRYTRPIPDWDEITGKPTVFPSNHEWTAITGKPAGFADDIDDVGLETVAVAGDLTGDGTPGNPITYTASASSFLAHYTSGGTNLASFSTRMFPASGNSSSANLTGDNSAGYVFTTSNAIETIIIEGDSGSSNASGEFVLTIDQNNTTVNTFKLGHFSYQLYDLTNDQKVDEHLTGNVLRQVYDSTTGETQLTLPNVGGNYPNGFRLILN